MDIIFQELRPKVKVTVTLNSIQHFMSQKYEYRERSDTVVECLTRDREAAGSSPTGVTMFLEQDTFILA